MTLVPQKSWLVVSGFNVTLTAKVISWRSVTLCIFWLSHASTNTTFLSETAIFSHASAEVRGENTPERKVASTVDLTCNHQVMSLTSSPLSHPGVAPKKSLSTRITHVKYECSITYHLNLMANDTVFVNNVTLIFELDIIQRS